MHSEKTEDIDIATLLEYKGEIGNPLPEQKKFRDYRLLNLQLLNVRFFPFDAAIPYGLDLTNKNREACSAFIVGNNGLGKSTIYCALEYLYTGNCSYAKRLEISYEGYLKNLFASQMPINHQTMNIFGKNPDQLYIQSLENNPKGTPAAFTSDYDIEQLERSSDNLFTYVLQALGYEDVLFIQNKIKEIIQDKGVRLQYLLNYTTSIDAELNALDYQTIKHELVHIALQKNEEVVSKLLRFSESKTVDSIIHSIKQGSPSINFDEELFSDNWKELSSNLQLVGNAQTSLQRVRGRIEGSTGTILTDQEISYSIRRIKTLYRKLKEYYNKLNSQEEIQSPDYILKLFVIVKELEKEYQEKDKQRDVTDLEAEMKLQTQNIEILQELYQTIKNGLSNKIVEYKKNFGQFIEETMKSFSTTNEINENFNLVCEESSINLKLILDDPNNETKVIVSPRTYFNTFRFKLYVISLRLSLAFTFMMENNILIPIVIDDVFSASDFENGLKIEQFVYNIYKIYNQKLNFSVPLQLILLTHDEMILNSFRRGIKLKYEFDAKNSGKMSDFPEDYFVCGRLFPYWKRDELIKYSKSKLGFYNIFFHFTIDNS